VMKNFGFKIPIPLLAFSFGIISIWFVGGFLYLAILLEPIVSLDIPQTSEVFVIPNSLDWDLTYTSVLEKNNFAHCEFLLKWRKAGYQGPNTRHESPAQKWIEEWQGEPIISSILIDFPAPHAGEHINIWFVRTENHAYHWSLLEDDRQKEKKQELDPQVYDNLFAQVSAIQQAAPPRIEDLSTDTPPGEASFFTNYIGFLSLYDKGKSRQMLLLWQDFIACDSRECCRPECKTLKSGRLFRVLETIDDLW
jgi:hypothetical protein